MEESDVPCASAVPRSSRDRSLTSTHRKKIALSHLSLPPSSALIMGLHAGWVTKLSVPPNVRTASSTHANIPSTAPGSSRTHAKSAVAGAPKPPPQPVPARKPAQTPVTPPPTAAAKGKRREVPEPSSSPEPVAPPSKRPRVEDAVDEDTEVPGQHPVEELPDDVECFLLRLLPLLDITDTQVPSL